MIPLSIIAPSDDDELQGTTKHSAEVPKQDSSPPLSPLLLRSQLSTSPGPRLESISESDHPNSQILPGPLYAEPPEGLSPGDGHSFPPLTPLPLQSPPRSPGGTLHPPSPSRPNRPPHPTRASTTFGASTRPEHGPLRWPYSREALTHLISRATDTILSVSHNPDNRDAEALNVIWSTYYREATAFDKQMIASWQRNLDVRLLFAGIFSAIITPFIGESYKLLVDPSHKRYAVRVNVMWFGSLITSLIAALLAIHCKQWLDEYPIGIAPTDSNLLHVCRLRQYRYQGLQKYRIREVIGLLPILLYFSLLSFALGLIDWLWHLNNGIAIYISVLCGIVVLFGLFTTILPIFTTRSPYKTPMSNLLGNLSRSIYRGELKIKGLMEEEEMDDVDAQGEFLDKQSFRWLMKNTRSEGIYQDTLRAQREFDRRLNLHRRGGAGVSSC